MARPKKVAVLLESHYDGTEPAAIENVFPIKGYELEYVSNLRGKKQAVFHNNDDPSKTITVTKDIDDVNLADYTGVILIGGYAMDMLRYEVEVEEGDDGRPKALPKASAFAVKALNDPELTIGTICHSLWIFTPAPDSLKGRSVTCGHNILYDVLNTGAKLVYDKQGKKLVATCVDGNLVTARHPFVVEEFMDTYLLQLKIKEGGSHNN
jgi:putative intracellular protease/amidase